MIPVRDETSMLISAMIQESTVLFFSTHAAGVFATFTYYLEYSFGFVSFKLN